MERKNIILLTIILLVLGLIIAGSIILFNRSASNSVSPQDLLISRKDVPAGLDPVSQETTSIQVSEKIPLIVYTKIISTPNINVINKLFVFEKSSDSSNLSEQEIAGVAPLEFLPAPDWAPTTAKFYRYLDGGGQTTFGFFWSQKNYLWALKIFGQNLDEKNAFSLLAFLDQKMNESFPRRPEIKFSTIDYQQKDAQKLEQPLSLPTPPLAIDN